jgi:hypothetical protein
MFLRPYCRTKNGKTHVYFALVESIRTAAGPRQHVVAHLGELGSAQERRWQRTVLCYNRQGDAQPLQLFADDELTLPDDPGVVRIRLDKVGWTNGRRFGDIWLAHWLWQFLQLDQTIARHVPQGKETVAPADVIAIEVINRLCQPCSEFAVHVEIMRFASCICQAGRAKSSCRRLNVSSRNARCAQTLPSRWSSPRPRRRGSSGKPCQQTGEESKGKGRRAPQLPRGSCSPGIIGHELHAAVMRQGASASSCRRPPVSVAESDVELVIAGEAARGVARIAAEVEIGAAAAAAAVDAAE